MSIEILVLKKCPHCKKPCRVFSKSTNVTVFQEVSGVWFDACAKPPDPKEGIILRGLRYTRGEPSGYVCGNCQGLITKDAGELIKILDEIGTETRQA